jgi:predicted Fe-Mo cluster-binding NifX family protein
MKIAVVTDDGNTIHRHFGRAKFYVMVTVEDGQITAREQVEKAGHHNHGGGHGEVHLHDDHDHDHDHEGGHGFGQGAAQRHADMFAPLAGCDVLLSRGMGRGAHAGLTQIGVKPIITDIATIDEAVAAVINNTIVDHPEKLH